MDNAGAWRYEPWVQLVGAEYRAAAAFVVLTVILLVRPTGLFGEKA